MFEVSETVGIVLWIAADHSDKGEKEERDDEYNLAAREPELSFAVCSDSKNIDDTV